MSKGSCAITFTSATQSVTLKFSFQTGGADAHAVCAQASSGSVLGVKDRNSTRASVLGSCMLHKLNLAEHNLVQPRTLS